MPEGQSHCRDDTSLAKRVSFDLGQREPPTPLAENLLSHFYAPLVPCTSSPRLLLLLVLKHLLCNDCSRPPFSPLVPYSLDICYDFLNSPPVSQIHSDSCSAIQDNISFSHTHDMGRLHPTQVPPNRHSRSPWFIRNRGCRRGVAWVSF